MRPISQMIIEYLQANDFDGLCNPEYECGCGLDDLWPCDFIQRDCVPAYLGQCPDPKPSCDFDQCYVNAKDSCCRPNEEADS